MAGCGAVGKWLPQTSFICKDAYVLQKK